MRAAQSIGTNESVLLELPKNATVQNPQNSKRWTASRAFSHIVPKDCNEAISWNWTFSGLEHEKALEIQLPDPIDQSKHHIQSRHLLRINIDNQSTLLKVEL